MIQVAVIALHNMMEWGFAIHDAAHGSLCLALPMFAIGTLLFFSGMRRGSRVDWLWWILLVLAGMVMGYFLWRVGADGVGLLIYVLRGGII